MDELLKRRGIQIQRQIDNLRKVEETYLNLDASKKILLAQLTMKAVGKSMAEREMIALASSEYSNFCLSLASETAEYNRLRRLLDLAFKAFDGEYLSLKLEVSAINRQK